MKIKTKIGKTNSPTGKRVESNIFFLFLLPVISGMLLAISALPSKFWYLGFISFIPLLIAAEQLQNHKRAILIFVLQLTITLLVFYIWVGSWVLQTANLGFLLGLIMVIPFVILASPYILLIKKGNKFAGVYFIAAWLSAEFTQDYFQLGTPFYNLGHNLGANPKLIQWYEFTGTAGGTLWILAVNFAILALVKTLVTNRKFWLLKSAVVTAVLFVPVIISLLIFSTYKEKGQPSEVVVIHPGTDNYDVKYRVNIYELMDIYLDIMLPQLTANTDYVVLPETAITNAGWVSDFSRNLVFQHFNEKTAAYPNLKLITGAITYEAIANVENIKDYKKMPGIRYSEKYSTWYYTYNAALQIDKFQPVQMRVKEGLVPYQEYAPYPQILPKLVPAGIDFQFTPVTNKKQVFTGESQRKTAAMICYELVFGNKFRSAVREGAQAFFVMLNEGWYTKAPKVKHQFLQLSVVRAIENRRYIAHSSNLGISAFINQRGQVVDKTESIQSGFLKHEIQLNNNKTMAAMLGNYPGILALIAVVLMPLNEYILKTKLITKK